MTILRLPLWAFLVPLILTLTVPQGVWAQELNDQCLSEAESVGAGAAGSRRKLAGNEVAAPKYISISGNEIMTQYKGQCTCRFSFIAGDGNLYVEEPAAQTKLIIPTDATGYTTEIKKRRVIAQELVMFCSDQALNEMYANKQVKSTSNLTPGQAEGPVAGTVAKYIIEGINGILWVIARILLWILQELSYWVGQLLGHGTYITHEFVRAGWPFVLGLANLGFVLALLFIAAATTLNLSSYSARRLLPKLLIAALLINFSLIIAGLMLDVTRIIMAGLAGFIGNRDLTALGIDILQKSNTLNAVVKVTSGGVELGSLGGDNTKWSQVLLAFQNVFLIGIITVGFAILALGLLIRHITLLLLLVISPLPYLAVALPGMSKYSSMWWNKFLTQLLYGPAALLVLVLLAIIGGAIPGSLLSIIFTAVMLGAAAKFGKTMGVVGGAALVGAIASGGKTAAKWTGRTTLRAAGRETGRLAENYVPGVQRAGDVFRRYGAYQKGRDEFYADRGRKAGKESYKAGRGKSEDVISQEDFEKYEQQELVRLYTKGRREKTIPRDKTFETWRKEQDQDENGGGASGASQSGQQAGAAGGTLGGTPTGRQPTPGGAPTTPPRPAVSPETFTGEMRDVRPQTLSNPELASALRPSQIEEMATARSPQANEQRAAFSAALASMPAEFANAMATTQIQAVLNTGNAPMIQGLASNPTLAVRIMADEQLRESLRSLNDPDLFDRLARSADQALGTSDFA